MRALVAIYKTIRQFAERAALWVVIRDLQIGLHDKHLCMPRIQDPIARAALNDSICLTAMKLDAAQERYLALRGAAKRSTYGWRAA